MYIREQKNAKKSQTHSNAPANNQLFPAQLVHQSHEEFN